MAWKQRLAGALLSRPLARSLRSGVHGLGLRLRCFLPSNLALLFRLRRQSELHLNIGCGKSERPGWIGIDLAPGPGAIAWDVTWGLPFPTGSVSAIHCEHFLEHLDYPVDAQFFLRECRRVLAPGASLRLIVPDARKYLMAYSRSDDAFFSSLSDLGGAQDRFQTEIQIINQMFRMGGDHLYAYDLKTLTLLLRESGFDSVQESTQGASAADLPESWRPLESLYVEATPPYARSASSRVIAQCED